MIINFYDRNNGSKIKNNQNSAGYNKSNNNLLRNPYFFSA